MTDYTTKLLLALRNVLAAGFVLIVMCFCLGAAYGACRAGATLTERWLTR